MRRQDTDVQPIPGRMEPGNLSMIALALLDRGLSVLLNIGTERLENHARVLALRLRHGLVKQGRTVLGPDRRESLWGNTFFCKTMPQLCSSVWPDGRPLAGGTVDACTFRPTSTMLAMTWIGFWPCSQRLADEPAI